MQENEEFRMQDLTYNDLDRIEFYQTQNDPQFLGYCDDVSKLPLDPGIPGSTGLYDLDSYKWNLIEIPTRWEVYEYKKIIRYTKIFYTNATEIHDVIQELEL